MYTTNTVDHMLTEKSSMQSNKRTCPFNDALNAMLISHIFNIQLAEQVPSDTTQDIGNIDNPTSDIDTIATQVISEKRMQRL